MHNFEILEGLYRVPYIFFCSKNQRMKGARREGRGNTLFLRRDTDIAYPFREKIWGVFGTSQGVLFGVHCRGALTGQLENFEETSRLPMFF